MPQRSWRSACRMGRLAAVVMGMGLVLGLDLGLGISTSHAATVEVIDDPHHPLWTLVPTRIDRSREVHQRIAPDVKPTDTRLILTVTAPVAIDETGQFRADDKDVRLAGIQLPARDRICGVQGGARWACGLRAYARVTALLTQSQLQCEQINPLGSSVATVRCASRGSDVALHLLAEGWALPASDATDELTDAATLARTRHRGVWSPVAPES